jgi:hypothetical protein
VVYGHDSSEFARSGRERGSDERCEAFCCGELRAFSGRPPRSLARQVRQAPPRYNPTGREREYGGWDWPCVTELRLRPKQTSTRVALKTRELRRTEFDSQGQLSRQSDRSRSASVESALLCDHCRYRKGDGRDRELGSAWRRPARTQGDEHKGRAYDHGGEQPPIPPQAPVASRHSRSPTDRSRRNPGEPTSRTPHEDDRRSAGHR